MTRGGPIYLFASGDSREAANRTCWPAQAEMEARLGDAVAAEGRKLVRAHPVKESDGHGFLASTREGMAAFAGIEADAPVIVAEAAWQYSNHILPGLLHHRGPILTVANWSGQWPGLVGVLNLNGSLAKAGRAYQTLWSGDFADAFFRDGLRAWLAGREIAHDRSHLTPFGIADAPQECRRLGRELATALCRDKVLLGVFDEGCMGMYNAILPDELLAPLGVFKERLSQSALYFATTQVPDAEAEAALAWLERAGVDFAFGKDETTELTRAQALMQCKLYIAAAREADRLGCDAIGIQYQQGLKDLLPASDLAEGMLNNAERPPVTGPDGAEIRPGAPILHFNEVDEGAGLDAVISARVHAALGEPVETTLHDLRWGDLDRSGESDDFIWVFQISGAAPPAHYGGWNRAIAWRQRPMYFRLGGATLRGVAKPGAFVWSRLFVEDGRLNMDIGTGEARALPEDESERRWRATSHEWPIMHAVTLGVSRDQMMARHKANHVQVAYASSPGAAHEIVAVKAAMADALGMSVTLCGAASAVAEG